MRLKHARLPYRWHSAGGLLLALTPLVSASCSSSKGTIDGGGEGDAGDPSGLGQAGSASGGGGSQSSNGLGTICAGDCDGAYCFAEDSACENQTLDHPCTGTASGMYCSVPCVSDNDCAGSTRPMRCITSCEGEVNTPSIVGRCWLVPDYVFLTSTLCEEPVDGTAGDSGVTGGSAGTGLGGSTSTAANGGVAGTVVTAGMGGTSGTLSGGQGGTSGNGGSVSGGSAGTAGIAGATGGEGGSSGLGTGGAGGTSGTAGASGTAGTAGDAGEGGSSGVGGTGGTGGGAGTTSGTGGTGGSPPTCFTERERRCAAGVLEECTEGDWAVREECESGCADATTCACSPGEATRCIGETPAICRAEGYWDEAETCSETCYDGDCCKTYCEILTCDVFYGCTCTNPYLVCENATQRCDMGDRRCIGRTSQECDADRTWQVDETCPYVCAGAGECTGQCTPNATRCKQGSVDVVEACDSTGKWVAEPACYYACVNGDCGGSCKPDTTQCLNAITAQTCSGTGTWSDGETCPFGCFGGSCSTQPDTCAGVPATPTELFFENFDGYATGALETVADSIWIRSGNDGRGQVGAHTNRIGTASLDLDRLFDYDGSYYRKLVGLPPSPRKLSIELYATIDSDFGPDPGLDFGLVRVESKFVVSRALSVRFNEHDVRVSIAGGTYATLSNELDFATAGFTYVKIEFDFCAPAVNVYSSKTTPEAATLVGNLPVPAAPVFDAFYMNGTWLAPSYVDDIRVSAED